MLSALILVLNHDISFTIKRCTLHFCKFNRPNTLKLLFLTDLIKFDIKISVKHGHDAMMLFVLHVFRDRELLEGLKPPNVESVKSDVLKIIKPGRPMIR